MLRDTDLAVRTFLAKHGLKKGGLAKFVEAAVRCRVLDRTVAEANARNAKVPRAGLDTAIDKSVAVVRAERTAALKR